jgi:3-dehydroquinate synthase
MKKIKVNTLLYPYTINVANNLAESLTKYINQYKIGDYGIVLTNKTIYQTYKKKIPLIFRKTGSVKYRIIVLPDTERIKSFTYIPKICRQIGNIDFKRQVFFICWGGGVIGDLGGFIASIYKRGTPYIQMPTSLLAQIDSSIGGKTAIDLTTGKNLIGSFWQPRLVLTDLSFLKTLPPEQIREGLAEAVKYGLIKDKDLFIFLEKNYPRILKAEYPYTKQLVYSCAKIKKEIIEVDEREEKGIRTILNFGHTIGHAIETCKDYRLSHGKAVSLGMLSALYIAKAENILTDASLIQRTQDLLSSIGLPKKIKLNLEKTLAALKKDKKFLNKKTRMVFITSLGKATVRQNISLARIRQGIKSIMS